MQSGIFKTLIIFGIGISSLFLSFFIGKSFNKINIETKDPEIIGKLDFTTSFKCSSKKEDLVRLRDREYQFRRECYLLNDRKVKFDLSFSCERRSEQGVCKVKINPTEEDE